MNNITYHPRASGRCHIVVKGLDHIANFEFGLVEVERGGEPFELPRLAGYFVKIEGPDGAEWIGRSTTSVITAMKQIDGELSGCDGRLLCAGLHPDFYETALSEGSGFGYIAGYRDPVHIMERPLLDTRAKLFSVSSQPTKDMTPAQEFVNRLRGRKPASASEL